MRMFCVLFCFCFLLVGCGNEKTDKNVIEINEKILNQNFEFYSTEYKTTMMVTEYLELLEDTFQNDSSYYIHEYALFDLDFDGNNELIYHLGTGEDKYFGTVVFHAIGNTMYSYDFSWRGFGVLKTDGTVPYSLSGYDAGFRMLSFTKDGYTNKKSTYSESVMGDREIININYYVNNEQATKEEFDNAYEKHNKIDDVKFEEVYLDKDSFK